MALGWVIDADANLYLLIGVPITLAFQWWVARRPLHTLWVRDASGFQLDAKGFALAGAFAFVPAYRLAAGIIDGRRELVGFAWLACAIAGAFGAAYAFRHFRDDTFRILVKCTLTAGLLGAALMTAAWLARPDAKPPSLGAGLESLLMYLPVCFVLEEVFFRGALDAHVHRPGETRHWASAIFVSVLWGLWHMPIVPNPGTALIGLLIVHTAIGIPLSFCWRGSGNLAVPAASHAVIDAVRNALLR